MSLFAQLPNRLTGSADYPPAGWGKPLTRAERFERAHPKIYRFAYLVKLILAGRS